MRNTHKGEEEEPEASHTRTHAVTASVPVEPLEVAPVMAVVLGDSQTAQSHESSLHSGHVLS